MSDLATLPTSGEMTGSLLNFVAEAVTNPATDVAKLDALLRMQREIIMDQAKDDFAAALHAAQREMPRVKKNGTIDMGAKGSMKFAKWEDVDAVLRPIMDRYGFSLWFDTEERQGGGSVIIGTLTRGKWSQTAKIALPLDTGAGRNNLQAAGSTLSYGKRYVAEMIFNIVREGEDDDGTAGGKRHITEQQAGELREMMRQAKRQEGPLLDRLFGGQVRACEEIEAAAYIVVKNMLDGIIHQQRDRGDATN